VFGSFFKKKPSSTTSKEPTVSDLYGDMPPDSFFSKIADVVQQRMTLSESQFKVDWTKTPPVKPEKPDYGGILAFYAYQLALELDTDAMSLMFDSSYALKYQDGRRVDRSAANYAFYLFAGLYIARSIDSSDFNEFIRSYKFGLVNNFIFDKSEISTFGVDVANRGEFFFKSLADDHNEETTKFLEDIGKFFVATVALRYESDSEKFAQVKDYGTKLFRELERGLLSLKV